MVMPFMTIIIVITIFAWVAIRIASNRSNREKSDELGQYLMDDMRSNTSRRKDVPEELFYTPDLSLLPFSEVTDPAMSRCQKETRERAKARMLHFEVAETNIQLKQKYGAANLEIIAGYEENYQRYLRALISWAEALLAAENPADAETVLRMAVEMCSEHSKVYTLLSDLYERENAHDKLNELYTTLQSSTAFTDNAVVKNKLLGYINNARSKSMES